MQVNKDILSYLDQIIASTQTDTIDWQKANPTTFVWTIKKPSEAKITIQFVRKTLLTNTGVRKIKRYILEATDPTNSTPRFSITGDDNNRELFDKLETLFNAINESFTRKGLYFLKSILPVQERE